MVQPRPLFVYFCLFFKCYRKNCYLQRDLNSAIVGLEGDHAGHLTTTTKAPLFLRNSYEWRFLTTELCYRKGIKINCEIAPWHNTCLWNDVEISHFWHTLFVKQYNTPSFIVLFNSLLVSLSLSITQTQAIWFCQNILIINHHPLLYLFPLSLSLSVLLCLCLILFIVYLSIYLSMFLVYC